MASLVCVPSSPFLTKPIHYPKQKPKSLISCSSRNESQKSALPLFSLTHRPLTLHSTRASTTATKAAAELYPIPADGMVEHIVVLTMPPAVAKAGYAHHGIPDKTADDVKNSFITALNSLKCLPGVIYLSAGYVEHIYPRNNKVEEVDYFLHSRHPRKADLSEFMRHPLKLGFTQHYTEGKCTGCKILDYVPQKNGELHYPVHGSGSRYVFLKLRSGLDAVQKRSLRNRIRVSFPGCTGQLTSGYLQEPTLTIPHNPNALRDGYSFGANANFNETAFHALMSPETLAADLTLSLGNVLADEQDRVLVIDYVFGDVYLRREHDDTA